MEWMESTRHMNLPGDPGLALSELEMRVNDSLPLYICHKLLDKNSGVTGSERVLALMKGGEVEKKILRLRDKADWCLKFYMLKATTETVKCTSNFSSLAKLLEQAS